MDMLDNNSLVRSVYLGAYDDEEAAARAYDLAALKYWGPGTLINFPVSDYTRDLEEMQNFSREEYLASLRRKSSGFSRGISKYRGFSSRWEPSYGHVDLTTSIAYIMSKLSVSHPLVRFSVRWALSLRSVSHGQRVVVGLLTGTVTVKDVAGEEEECRRR
ncbi:hypothetical protein K1719_021370 [Acacia pycnantha]|nr:hypothetical protein K1719_021370 [Acacia pycnantha]